MAKWEYSSHTLHRDGFPVLFAGFEPTPNPRRQVSAFATVAEMDELGCQIAQALNALTTTARLVKDRERDDIGLIFDMPSDDAVDTVHSLIDEARAIMNMADRPNEDNPGTDKETEEPTITAV